jgi:hypothetical protein
MLVGNDDLGGSVEELEGSMKINPKCGEIKGMAAFIGHLPPARHVNKVL